MEYKIQYGDNFIEFSDMKWFEPDIEIEVLVKANSNGFGGASVFGCYYDDFEKFVSELKMVYNFEAYKADLKDMYYDSYLTFKADKTGHIYISGTLYDLHKVQRLDFCFKADQTSLSDFLKKWRTFK